MVYETRAPANRPTDYVELGPALGAELDRRLLGDVTGKRVLVLGCGAGHDAVGLSQRGARVIAVDADRHQVDAARTLATTNDARVEFNHADLAELAFVRADQIDLTISVAALSFVDDIDRVLRQVHRVMRTGTPAVLALPHAAALCRDPADPNRVIRPFDHRESIDGRYVHSTDSIVTSLLRANFAIDLLMEHRSSESLLPGSVIVRARRLGT